MKGVRHNILGLASAVVVAQVIDFVWYSGLLAFQPALERDLVLTVVKDVILAIASFVIYETFYDGDSFKDVFEFSLMFTVMHFALDDKPMVTTTSEVLNNLISMSHSILILFSIISVVHLIKKVVSKASSSRRKSR